jgi:hypothetical protein
MSYYQIKVAEMRRAGCEVRELGDEIAIVSGPGDDCLLIGGDAPSAYSRPGPSIRASTARRIARLGRTCGGEAAVRRLAAALERAGLSECAW